MGMSTVWSYERELGSELLRTEEEELSIGQ